MLKFIVALTTFFVLVAGEKKSFENYQVFTIVPATEEEINFMKEFDEMNELEYSFWKSPSFVNNSVDLMVAPNKIDEFTDLMNSKGMKYEIKIGNVQRAINEENEFYTKYEKRQFGWQGYHELNEINYYLEKLAEDYPENVELVIAGESYEGNKIMGVKLSFGENNPGVFIEGGIHAREWISPATVTYIINEFLTSNQPEIRQLAESNDWYIFPVFNPDGYDYTHKTNRLWRKSRKSYGYFCTGADLNRNWGYEWKNGGSSGSPCSQTYAGSAPFSEKETKSLSDYIRSISDKFYAYIAFHSYSQLVLLPYGHTTQHLDNYDDLLAIGTKAIEALEKRHGTKYRVGNIPELLYVATGGSMDWVKHTFNTSIAFTYELRDTGDNGFILPAEQIIPTGEETIDSLIALFKEASARGIPNRN